MALELSGILNLVGSSAAPTRSIQYELEGVYTGIGLLEAGSLASFTAPIAITDFYGYSAGSTILVGYNSTITWSTNTASFKDGYRSLNLTGRQSGDVITINFSYDFTETSGSVVCQIYTSINSTTTWTTKKSMSASESGTFTFPGIDDNDVARVRISIQAIKAGVGDVDVTITGGSFTSGSGTITPSGTTTWNVAVSL